MVSISKSPAGLGKFPNVIIAGAPKCGTSSLFYWIGAHPQVCASKVKETYFLADEVSRHNESLNVHQHDLGAYSSLFWHCKSEDVRLEATPVYMYHQAPLKYLLQLTVIPKVIFILRKPGDRIYSHWRFNRYRMKNIKMSFEEYVEEGNVPGKWRDYLADTHYVKFLFPWVECFGQENILVYQFEKLLQEKVKFMKGVAEDLGIDPGFYGSFDFFHRNETVAVKSKKLHRWGLKLESFVPQVIQEKIIPVYLKLNSKKAPPISDHDRVVKEKLNQKYAESNRKLKELFPQIDLSLWESDL